MGGVVPGQGWAFLEPGFGAFRHYPMDMPGLSSADGLHNGDQVEPSLLPPEEREGTGSDKPSTPEAAKSACLKQLTQVTLDLDTIWTSIFPRSHLHMPFDDSIDRATADLSAKYSHESLLQDFFGAAQRLIDVYPTAARLCLVLCPEDITCTDPSCIHHLPIPPSLRPVDEAVEARNSPSTIDLALGSLLVSCHLRVLDVLDRILALAISCERVTLNSPRLREPEYSVPVVKVGSFTPTRDASAFMQAYLMKHLVTRLGVEAARLGADVGERVRGGGEREWRVFAMQCEVLVERQEVKVGQLKVLGEELARVGMLR